jgi:hypothetical protein
VNGGGKERQPLGTTRRDLLPARLLPVLYFGLAHLFLVSAFVALVLDPAKASGFFYQPRTIAMVHLVTLGWISGSILGALYVIGPIALRTPMPARPPDYVAFILFSVGSTGMAAHFFIEEYRGVAWAAVLVLGSVSYVGVRTTTALQPAPIQPAVKLHVFLAFVNVTGAGILGILLALHKARPYLPGQPLSNVFAHVHLAALGWASMMVIGTGYRMLPMILPSAMPAGPSLMKSALLLEAGTMGLLAGFLLNRRFLFPASLLVAGAFGAFILEVRRMLSNRRRRPRWLPLPDYGVGHALESILYAGITTALGLALTVFEPSERTLRIAAVYGVFGIVGFLGQMIVGMQARILPLFATFHANLAGACEAPPTTPRDMGSQAGRALAFVLWTAGVPLLAGGMYLESALVVGIAGWALLGASVLGALNAAGALRHAFRRETRARPAA